MKGILLVSCLLGLAGLMFPRGAACAPPREQTATLTRDRQSRAATLHLSEQGAWKLFAGTSPETISFDEAVAQGQGAGSFSVPVDSSRRLYFALEQNGAWLFLAEQRLPIRHAYNIRDLGGIPTADGRLTAFGKLFRADDLASLDEDDLGYLASIPLACIVDFRAEREAERKPDAIPASVKHVAHLPLSPGRLDLPASGSATGYEQWERFMIDLNRALVNEQEFIAVYRQFFALLQDEKKLPLLFHCSAGKDRTGLAAALILLALGVDKKTVLEDYMLSAKYLAGKYDHLIREQPEREPLFSVRPAYLQSALDSMEKKNGGVEGFLTRDLGVNIPLMRERFLQKTR